MLLSPPWKILKEEGEKCSPRIERALGWGGMSTAELSLSPCFQLALFSIFCFFIPKIKVPSGLYRRLVYKMVCFSQMAANCDAEGPGVQLVLSSAHTELLFTAVAVALPQDWFIVGLSARSFPARERSSQYTSCQLGPELGSSAMASPGQAPGKPHTYF